MTCFEGFLSRASGLYGVVDERGSPWPDNFRALTLKEGWYLKQNTYLNFMLQDSSSNGS